MWWLLGCCSAAAGVALGAFGAHGLKYSHHVATFNLPDKFIIYRARISDTNLLANWQTATFYQ